ncbi:MAG: class I SAM-dependent methyltransferase [Gemmatimonadales bacterium]|nr:MAG: class I SAM-dependent methyltransferase [Gemmatimonadales bacterium]
MNWSNPSLLLLRVHGSLVYRISRWVASRKRHVFRRQLASRGLGAMMAIPSFTTEDELIALYELACASPLHCTAVEVGSYLGASACYIAAGLAPRSSRLICVDTWQNETMPDGVRDTFSEFLRNTAACRETITTLRLRSRKLLPDALPSELALGFIDGDHSFDGVRCDVGVVAPHISEGGILAFHDAPHFAGVSKVIGELLQTGHWAPRGQVGNLVWLCKKRFEK